MSIREIKYIGYYSHPIIEQENRNFFLSAVNKMNYIKDALNKNGLKVCMVSTSSTKSEENIKFNSNEYIIDDKFKVKTFKTFGAKNKIKKLYRRFMMDHQLFWYLIKNTKKNEPIIVYHSISIIFPILLAKIIKKFKLVLELEEKYQDAKSLSLIQRFLEDRIIKSADKYIFATELFEQIVGTYKPFVICNGAYQVVKKYDDRFSDDKIHVVYAGIIDTVKKGAFGAVDLGKYLDPKYHIHIIGFGKDEDIISLKKYISYKKLKAEVTYDGIKTGDEYNQFLQKCHIGLSTQDPNLIYNNSSFPSKILSYLGNGLRVVTVDIPVIRRAKINDLMYYYSENNSKKIAEVISKISFEKSYDSRERIELLDEEFANQIYKMLF